MQPAPKWSLQYTQELYIYIYFFIHVCPTKHAVEQEKEQKQKREQNRKQRQQREQQQEQDHETKTRSKALTLSCGASDGVSELERKVASVRKSDSLAQDYLRHKSCRVFDNNGWTTQVRPYFQ